MSIITPINYNHNIQKAIDAIECNFSNELSMEELSHISGYSFYHFQRLFKHYTSESVHQYINRLRIEKAASMLKYENNTVCQAASRVGYPCNSSFSRVFKQYFRISPKEYRDFYKSKFLINESPEFEIVEMEEKNLFFLRTRGNYKFSEPRSCKLLEKNYQDLINQTTNYVSICYDEPTISIDQRKMRYDACIMANGDEVRKFDNLPSKTISKGKYAKFKFEGTLNELDNFFYTIYETFFHNKLYQISIKPAVQLHHNSFKNLLYGTTKTDLFIPLD